MTIVSGILVYVMYIELQCHTKSSHANCISTDHEILQTIQKKENQNSKMIPESPKSVQNILRTTRTNLPWKPFVHPSYSVDPPGETKVQLQGTIANAQKMMGDDFEFLGFQSVFGMVFG